MSIEGHLSGEARRAEVFRKGLVTAIDTSVSPDMATINGRRMPYIDEGISVGDVVYYVDQPDPFAWARTIPDGGAQTVPFVYGEQTYRLWYPERDLDPSNYVTMLHPLAKQSGSGYVYYRNGIMIQHATYGHTETTAVLDSIDTLVSDHGHPVTSSWPAPPYAVPDDVTVVYQDVDGMSLVVTSDVGDQVLGPPMFRLSGWSYEDRPTIGMPNSYDTDVGYINQGYGVVRGFPSIRTAVWATSTTDLPGGVKTYFPSVSAPGAEWGLLYFLHVPNNDHDKVGGRDSTISISKGFDDSSVLASLSGTITPVTQGVNFVRGRTIGAGDPGVWVQPASDVPGCMLSSVVLNADPTWTGPGWP